MTSDEWHVLMFSVRMAATAALLIVPPGLAAASARPEFRAASPAFMPAMAGESMPVGYVPILRPSSAARD